MTALPHWIVSDIVAGLWLVWFAYWIFRSFGNKPTLRGPRIFSVILDRMIIVAAVLIFFSDPMPRLRLYPINIWTQCAGLLLFLAGIAISFWARVVLGRNWSGVAMVKQNHELVRSGPYRAMRHPIYSGIILGLIGTVVAVDPYVWAVVAVFLMALSFKIRSLREEKLMLVEFPEAYPQYMREVKSLIPCIY